MKKLSLMLLALFFSFSFVNQSDACQKNSKNYHGKNGIKIFKMKDLNKDGKLVLEEYKAYHQKRFDRLDKNKNGKITRREAKAANHLNYYKSFGKKTRKGYLTFKDTFKKYEMRFNRADLNHDGKITKREYKKYYKSKTKQCSLKKGMECHGHCQCKKQCEYRKKGMDCKNKQYCKNKKQCHKNKKDCQKNGCKRK